MCRRFDDRREFCKSNCKRLEIYHPINNQRHCKGDLQENSLGRPNCNPEFGRYGEYFQPRDVQNPDTNKLDRQRND